MQSSQIIWQPPADGIEETELAKFIDFVNKKDSLKLGTNYLEIWDWSVKNTSRFWDLVWDFTKIIGEKGSRVIEDENNFPGAKFFPDSKINYAENILRNPSDEVAIEEFGEKAPHKKLSRKERRSCLRLHA